MPAPKPGARAKRPAGQGMPNRAEQERFLLELRHGWSKTYAANVAGRDVRRFLDLEHRDERFKAEVLAALEEGIDTLRDEARRRAVDGVRDFRLDRDGNEHELVVYSDKLLELELKRRDFNYRERQALELVGAGGKPLEIGVRVEHDYAAILEALEEAGLISLGPAARAGDAAPLELLPARADGEAVGRPGSSPLPPD